MDKGQKMDFIQIVKNQNGTYQEYKCPTCSNITYKTWGTNDDIHVYCDKCGDDNERT